MRNTDAESAQEAMSHVIAKSLDIVLRILDFVTQELWSHESILSRRATGSDLHFRESTDSGQHRTQKHGTINSARERG